MDNIFAPLTKIETPKQQEMESRAQSALAMVKSMEVVDQVTYELAADELKAIKKRSKDLEEQRTSITKPINAALKAVNDLFRGPKQYLDEAETVIKQRMVAFTKEQQRIADEARREAEKQAEAERKRLAEEAAKIEEQAKKAKGEEAEKLVEQAKAIQQASELTTFVPQVSAPEKTQGISKISKTYSAEVTNKAEFLAFVLTRPELINLIDVNQSALNAQAKALKEAFNYPGVKLVESENFKVRV